MNINNDHKNVADDFHIVDLNELPKYSQWPSRLIGLSNWEPKSRRNQIVSKEYGFKWGKLLAEYKKHRFDDLNAAVKFIFQIHFQSHFLFCINEQIYYSENNDNFWNYVYSEIIQVLTKYLYPTDTLVELGCGWGKNLFCLFQLNLYKNAIGGEYTPEGLELGKLISKQYDLPIEFYHFDYNNPKKEFMGKLKNAVVFTHNSVEQINYISEKTIFSLIKNTPKAVIHFEPIFEYRNKDTLLHCLWKKYTEINDYNRNLLTVLKSFEKKGKIKIIFEKIHLLGLNAFNPGSFIVWEPVI